MPQNQDASDEPEINRKKRLIFRSWHRGTKEMDLILGSFADAHVMGFGPQELDQYERILTYNDPDLYGWISGSEQPPANIIDDVFQKILDHRLPKK